MFAKSPYKQLWAPRPAYCVTSAALLLHLRVYDDDRHRTNTHRLPTRRDSELRVCTVGSRPGDSERTGPGQGLPQLMDTAQGQTAVTCPNYRLLGVASGLIFTLSRSSAFSEPATAQPAVKGAARSEGPRVSFAHGKPCFHLQGGGREEGQAS